MRIGVALPRMVETVGGGFTFEHAVMDGLLRRVASTHHELWFLGFAATWNRAGDLPSNARYLDVRPSIEQARSWLLDGSLTRLCALPHTNERGRWDTLKSSMRESLLVRHGIQCLLHLSSQTEHTDIPYVNVVWDIEHRLQPYFPELSANGEWARRDQHYRSAVSRAAAVITGTEVGRKQLEQQYGVAPERVLILPHPTPADALEFGQSVRRPRAPQEPTLFYPAQFWAHKNHVGLLHALRILAERHRLRPTLLLAGSDKGNRAHVEQYAKKLGLTAQVRFLGFIPRQQVLKLYAESSALVYPSTFGPENLPPLEAFAIGCPVAAARIPGAEEQLGAAALLFDPHDHSAMADALYAVLCDEALRKELVTRGHARAQRWSTTHFADGLFTWFDRFAVVRDLWP